MLSKYSLNQIKNLEEGHQAVLLPVLIITINNLTAFYSYYVVVRQKRVKITPKGVIVRISFDRDTQNDILLYTIAVCLASEPIIGGRAEQDKVNQQRHHKSQQNV